MTSREIGGGTDRMPYEPMTEHLAREKLNEIRASYGENPHVIIANLEQILHEYGHDCLELGASLVETFPDTGPVDIMEAYVSGYNTGIAKRENK